MKLIDKDTVRSNILGSISNQLQNSGISTPNVSKSSHFYFTADAVATVLTGLQTDIANSIDQSDITKTSGQILDDIGNTIKFADGTTLTRKQPSTSLGYISLSAVSGQSVYIDSTYQLTDASGRVYQILQSGYYSNLNLIQIKSIQTGSNQNLAPNTVLKWRQTPVFANPTCKTFGTISGGTGTEDDNAYRNRILLAKQNSPPGSALDIVSSFNNISPYTDFVYCYPTFQGPATAEIIATQSPAASLKRSRVLPQQAINLLYQKSQTNLPGTAQYLVQTVTDNPLYMAFLIDSNGWLDQYQLPAADPTTFAPITLTSVSSIQIVFNSPYNFTLFSNPLNCNINIQWISPYDFTVVNSYISSYTTSGTGPYTITGYIQNPLSTVNGSAQAGDYIFPSNSNTSKYLNTVLNSFAKLGPGEIYIPQGTVNNGITPRTARVPAYTQTQDCRITNSFMSDLISQTDIQNVGVPFLYDTINAGMPGQIQLNTPPTPSLQNGSTTYPPNIFVPQKIAFYPINGLSS